MLVHNGIIENARDIRAELESKGIKFHTETDTESAVQYLGYVYDGDPKEAIVKLTARIRGAFALVIMFYDKPREIWVARKGSPLVVGTRGQRGILRLRPDGAARIHSRRLVHGRRRDGADNARGLQILRLRGPRA